MPKLIKTTVDNLKAPAKGDSWFWDTEVEGFGVRVQASGRKTYVIRYRTRDAKRTQRKMTIARCSDIPPDRARDLARKIFAQVAEGMDPALAVKPMAASQATVGKMFEGYIADMRKKGRVSATEVEFGLLLSSRNAADALGRDRPAADVTPRDVVNFVSKFYERGHRGAAHKARSYISSAYSWGMRSTNDYTTKTRYDWALVRNPAADVAKDPGATKARDRNLTAAEIKLLWDATAVEVDGFSHEVGVAVRMLVCCGQRVQETLRIDGAEIDLAAALWRMPANKTKGKKLPHVIPLPRQAIDILAGLIELHGAGPLFPARLGPAGEIMDHRTINHAIRRWLARADVDVAHFQSRDLRRTFKSRAHDAGVDRFTRDLIQQHAKSDTGSKNYDRSDYSPQMRDAMAKWSDWLDVTLA